MVITSTFLVAFGTWLGGKVVDKGFDKITDSLLSIDEKNKFYKIVQKTSKEISIKYPDIMGGNIEYFFKNEEIFNELMKLLFIDAKLDMSIIENSFDTSTIPNDFILEFIQKLKVNLLRDKDFASILGNKELYLYLLGIAINIDTLVTITTLSHKEVSEIKILLEEKFKEKFSLEIFKKQYFENCLNTLSQVNFIGLGIDLSIKNLNPLYQL